MNYQVLARKWRPHNFKEVVGQEHVVKSLINALQHNRLHHAYLFTGTRGVGKTTIARILAKATNCENLLDFNPCGSCSTCKALDEGRFLDLIEVDAASRTKVEDTRDLLDNAQYAPNQGRYKVYIIDEVHMLSGHSFNALLKTLEEPPEHVKFLLATTDPHKIPVTVLSRCLQFNLKRLSPTQILEQMAFILDQETIPFEQAALKLLSNAADGSMRDGLSLLDQAIVYGNGTVPTEEVRNMLGTIALQPVDDLLLALADHDAPAILSKINEIDDLTPDFSDVLQQILQVLHRVALVQQIPTAIDENFDTDVITDLAAKISPADVQLFYQIGLIGQRDLNLAPDPKSGFEMVMLRMLTFKPASLIAAPSKSAPSFKADLKIAPSANQTQPKHIAQPIEKPLNKTPELQTRPLPQVQAQTHTTPHAQPLLIDNPDWLSMILAMKLTGMTKEFASNCILESLNEQTCTLTIDPNYLRSSRAEDALQKALQTYIGSPLKLIVQTQKITQETPAIQLVKARENQQQEAVDIIHADPNILALKNNFDARILPGTIEPIKPTEEDR